LYQAIPFTKGSVFEGKFVADLNFIDDDSKKHRQSCGPILEDDEGPEDPRPDMSKRRPSLQSTGSVGPVPLSPLHPRATPPRTSSFRDETSKPSGHQFFSQTSHANAETEKLPMSNLRDRAHTVSGAGLRGLAGMSQRRGSGSVPAGSTPESSSQSKVIFC
jgi:hypothetical protein